MRESNLKVMSRRRCPKSHRPGCVDSVSCLVVSYHEAMNSNAVERNNLAMRVTLVLVANKLKAILLSF